MQSSKKPNVLLQIDREELFRDKDHIKALQGAHPEFSFQRSESPDSLLEALDNAQADALIVFCKNDISDGLYQRIRQLRRHASLRDCVLIFSFIRADTHVLRKTFLLGAKHVFVEPVSQRQMENALLSVLGHKSAPATMRDLREAIKIKARTFGRVSAIATPRFESLTVELNAACATGDKVALYFPQAKIGDDSILSGAIAAELIGNIYNYARKYTIALDLPTEKAAGLSKIVAQEQGKSVGAKLKLLHVYREYDAKFLESIDADRFSVHCLRFADLNSNSLQRINPEVLVLEACDEALEQDIRQWVNGIEGPKPILIGPEAGCSDFFSVRYAKRESDFVALLSDSAKQEINQRLHERNQNFYFPAKSSSLSRCELTVDLAISGKSGEYLRAKSSLPVPEGAVVVTSGQPGGAHSEYFLRVVACNAEFILLTPAVQSQSADLGHKEMATVNSEANVDEEAPEGSFLEQTGQKNLSYTLITLIAGVGIIGVLYLLFFT